MGLVNFFKKIRTKEDVKKVIYEMADIFLGYIVGVFGCLVFIIKFVLCH